MHALKKILKIFKKNYPPPGLIERWAVLRTLYRGLGPTDQTYFEVKAIEPSQSLGRV